MQRLLEDGTVIGVHSPRVLVTGSRHWTDVAAVERGLRWAWSTLAGHPRAVLVQGECPYGGADAIAKHVWESWGLPVESFPAEHDPVTGRVLGPARNARMVASGADVCVAFPLPSSRGTLNCMRLAARAGIPVQVFNQDAGHFWEGDEHDRQYA